MCDILDKMSWKDTHTHTHTEKLMNVPARWAMTLRDNVIACEAPDLPSDGLNRNEFTGEKKKKREKKPANTEVIGVRCA